MRMSPIFRTYIDRIDAMSLRERALIFLACAAVIVAWVYSVLLQPILIEHNTLSVAMRKQRDEMHGWDVQLETMARARASGATSDKQVQLGEMHKRIADLDTQIGGHQRQLVPPEKMRSLLADVMRGRRSLKLMSLATLPPDSIAGVPGQEGAHMYRHGIELAVSGPYLDLLSYLSDLERLPAKLLWGSMQLTAAYPVATLKVTLYTFSPEKTWLAL